MLNENANWHLKTAKDMEKCLSELGFGLNGTELMRKAHLLRYEWRKI
jgi:hypothetical protein